MLRRKLTLVAFLALTSTVLGLVFGVFLAEKDLSALYKRVEIAKSKGLPKLEITLGETTLDEVLSKSKYERYGVSEVILKNKGEEISLGSGELKGRGNSTWGLEKSPFQIKLDKKADILGLGERKKWVLLANYFDETAGLRNDFAFKLAEVLGEKYAEKGKFVELYVNSQYEGLYYLVRKIEIGKNSVDIRGSGAVLAEFDSLHGSWEDYSLTENGSLFVFKDAVSEKDEEKFHEAKQDFLKRISEFEQAVLDRDYKKAEELVDFTSLAKYYLVNEFAVNPDGFASSYFFYTEGGEDKIHAGPVWDFDFAFANRRWVWSKSEDFYSPEKTMVRSEDIMKDLAMSGMIYRLMDYSVFRAEVWKVYQEEMAGKTEELLAYFDKKKEEITQAAHSDRARYYSNYNQTFEEATSELREYIRRRLEYFEKVYVLPADIKIVW